MYYRPVEAARLVGVSRQAVAGAITAGRPRAVETPDGKRVRGADLIARRGTGEVPTAPGREW